MAKTKIDLSEWNSPAEVTDVDLAFPARGVQLVPPMSALPHEIGEGWLLIARRWFYEGLPQGVSFVAKEGISAEAAYRHLSVVLGCYGLKHEHKEAAAAWLMSRWLTEVALPEGAEL